MALKDEIQAAQNQLAAAMAARDAQSAAQLYTDDPRLFPQGAPDCLDRSAIAGFFAGAFDSGIVSARFTTAEVDGDDSLAVETGRYELFAEPPGAGTVRVAEGRYLVVWKKVDGQWRIHRDMFNT
jgi:uncharacterized protein (TIGR02246 family)